MCGIAFTWQRNNLSSPVENNFIAGLSALRHRGPDEQKSVRIDNALLGHVRLSIIDVATSHQPMSEVQGQYHLIFNGEIYNYKELREELISDWSFNTAGDTEVLLAGLVLQGPEFIKKLEGMWAFLLWDSINEIALLSRDRTGKKPLFYESGTNFLNVCSELPALRYFSNSNVEDINGISDYFRYGIFLSGTTAFDSVKEVLPGHYLVFEKGVAKKNVPYWSLTIGSYKDTHSNAVEDLHNVLEQSVTRRLVSDVEVGCFLSGGVDSSVIAALAHRRIGKDLKTFTIGFASKSYDERAYATEVSNFLGTDHSESVVSKWRTEELRSVIEKHIGQPFFDSSILPTLKVSELAARKVKVALSGDGGDELFCGYQRYKSRKIASIYGALPITVRNQVMKMVRSMPEPTNHHSSSVLKKAHLFVSLFERLQSENPYIAPRLCDNDLYASLFPGLTSYGYQRERPESMVGANEVLNMMFSDVITYLPQDIHTKVDRASMCHSLEVRAPFMDKDVIELAFSFPLKWQLSFRINKPMLFNAFRGSIPKSIWRRRKQGFAVPIGEWFKHDLGRELEVLLMEQCNDVSWIDKRSVNKLLIEHQSGARDHGQLLWLIYVYMIWKQTF